MHQYSTSSSFTKEFLNSKKKFPQNFNEDPNKNFNEDPNKNFNEDPNKNFNDNPNLNSISNSIEYSIKNLKFNSYRNSLQNLNSNQNQIENQIENQNQNQNQIQNSLENSFQYSFQNYQSPNRDSLLKTQENIHSNRNNFSPINFKLIKINELLIKSGFSAIRIQRVKNGDSTEIIETLFQVLNEFKKEPELKNEYQNYELILQENSQLKNENFELKKQNQILKERIKYSNSTQEDEKTSPDNLKEDIHLLKQVLSHQQKFGKVIENTISKVESRINEFTESQSLTSKSEEHKTSSRNNHSPRSDKPSRDYLQFKQILDQICHNMKIDDYSLITPTFVRTISKLEDYKIFTNEMSKIVKSINSQNDSSFISLTRESSSKISNSIKNADLILSNLKKWKIELYHSQILKNFKFQIQNEIEKINILKDDPNIVNKTSLPIPIPVSIPKSIEISEIAFQKIILIIKNLIDFYISNITKQNPNQFNKISNQNQNQYENENEYEKLTQIIFHFEKKLGLKTNNNPLIAINTIYLELKRIQTQLQTFQKTLNVNESNSSFSECLTKIHNLIYFEKLYKNQIKI